jgi:hypothetical protein
LNVNDCPTPRKQEFDSRAEAEAKASISSHKTSPYLCQCGRWHLTMRSTTALVAEKEVVESLAAMNDDNFTALVNLELRGGRTRRARPRCALRRWHTGGAPS